MIGKNRLTLPGAVAKQGPQSKGLLVEPREIKRIISESNVQYLLVQFTDVLGHLKGIEVGGSRIDQVLFESLALDASAIVGRFRSKEVDGRLRPDLDTFAVLPFMDGGFRGARMIADLAQADGKPDGNCPRQVLRDVARKVSAKGLETLIAPEVEFFIFRRNGNGEPTLSTHDVSGYLDFAPDEPGQACRRDVVSALEKFGVAVRHAHHEIAPGQHELGLMPMPPLECADAIVTLRYVAKALAKDHGLIATFMPKPRFELAGSGLHLELTARSGGEDVFSFERGRLSNLAQHFIGGLLEHADGMCLLLNPLVNSYKRLVPGHEAPTHVYWSYSNIEPYVRVPYRADGPTAVEVRAPDPSCNPYLSIAAVLAAGLDGIERKIAPGEPIDKDIQRLSGREAGRLRVQPLPANLGEAVEAFRKDRYLFGVMGEVISRTVIRARSEEWESYIRQVHPWELDHYLVNT